jgi:hypothetical protein
MTKARTIADLGTGFVNISDTGTEGTKVASGTTAQRGSTTGQFRYNTTTNVFEGKDNSSFIALEAGIGITTISPTSFTPSENTSGNNNLTITGVGFKSGATVQIIGNNGTIVNASSVAVNSSTQIVAVIPTLNATLEPFDIQVTNSSGNSAKLDNTLQINTSPVWTTAAGTLATINDNATGVHATVAATDADGETITYSETTSVLSGAGLTLGSSNGQISGDPTNVNANTTYTFTLGASDGTDTTTRTFNIIVNKVNDGSTSARAAASAQAIRDLGITTAGVYYITNSGSNIPVWCDFVGTDGYMLAISINTANPSTSSVYNNNSSDDNEIQVGDTSPQSRDVISQLRRNRTFRYMMIKYENTYFSPTNTYYTNPPIYDWGSNQSGGFVNLGGNTVSRISGNSGILPISNCTNNGSYGTALEFNKSGSQHRDTKLSNYNDNSRQNTSGFFYTGSYNTQFDGGCNNGDTTKFELYIR